MTKMSLKMMNSPTSTAEFQNSSWRLKINRAVVLRVELETLISEYLSQFPPEIIDNTWNGRKMKVELRLRKAPDTQWSTLLGDIIHNYRSSLDSLYFSLISYLARARDMELSDDDQRRLAFPIQDTRRGFDKYSFGLSDYGSKLLKDDLSGFQPFEYINEFVDAAEIATVTSGHPLHILKVLSDIDKHRSLHLIHCYPYTYAIGLPVGVHLVSSSRSQYFPGQTSHFFDFEFEGASQDNKPSFMPHFKLGVFSSNSTPHSSDIMNLLHSIERKIFHILNQLEYHFQPGFGLDFVPETGLQPE